MKTKRISVLISFFLFMISNVVVLVTMDWNCRYGNIVRSVFTGLIASSILSLLLSYNEYKDAAEDVMESLKKEIIRIVMQCRKLESIVTTSISLEKLKSYYNEEYWNNSITGVTHKVRDEISDDLICSCKKANVVKDVSDDERKAVAEQLFINTLNRDTEIIERAIDQYLELYSEVRYDVIDDAYQKLSFFTLNVKNMIGSELKIPLGKFRSELNQLYFDLAQYESSKTKHGEANLANAIRAIQRFESFMFEFETTDGITKVYNRFSFELMNRLLNVMARYRGVSFKIEEKLEKSDFLKQVISVNE